MTTSQVTQVFGLDQAIGFALQQLEKLQASGTDQMTPGEVSSLINDICLDAGVGGRGLPVPLCELRLNAIERNGKNVVERNAPNFNLSALIRTLRASLELL